MANLFINLPAPGANGVGAAVDVSTTGGLKTIQMNGSWALPNRPPTINIEMNNDVGHAGTWAPVCTFQGGSGPAQVKSVDIAARWMRVRISGYRGGAAPDVNVGSTDDGTVFDALPAAAGNGTDTAVDISAMPALKTLQIGNTFSGSVILETSEDAGGVDWVEVVSMQAPGQVTFTQIAHWARIKRVGTRTPPGPGTPICSLGATTGGGGGGGGGGGSTPLILTNGNAGALVPATPVYSSASGACDKARGNAAASSVFLGLVLTQTASGGQTPIQTGNGIGQPNVATFTTAQWDAVTGQVGGLTPNAQYYIGSAAAGKLLIAPGPVAAGTYSTLVGQALDATRMSLTPADPVGPL